MLMRLIGLVSGTKVPKVGQNVPLFSPAYKPFFF